MPEDNLSTVQTELVPLAPIQLFLELRTVDRFGAHRLPFWTELLEFPINGETWTATLDGGEVLFQGPQEEVRTGLEQECRLREGRARVVDLRSLPRFWLVALSPELHHHSWPVLQGDTTIGRAGRRRNAVVFTDLSVSRTHATIKVCLDQISLCCESEALTAVNSRVLTPLESVPLHPNDVLQLGEFHFRLEPEMGVQLGTSGQISLWGLGRSRVFSGNTEIEWSHEHAKDLLFWLASCRGAELSVNRVMEEYWPERPTLRQRKNLSHVLGTLQSELQLGSDQFERLVIRTPETLLLNTDGVERCDFWSLKDALLNPRDGLRGTELTGVFYPRNERPWARTVRRELFVSWLESLSAGTLSSRTRALALEKITRFLRENDFEEFVYQSAFRLAQKLDAQNYAEMWQREILERDEEH